MASDDLNIDDFEYNDSEPFDASQISSLSQISVATDDTYIIHLTATREQDCNVALGLSNRQCCVYKLEGSQLTKICDLGQQFDEIIGLQFCAQDTQLLYSASKNCTKLWDLRTPMKPVVQFEDSTLENCEQVRPFTCFDVATNNRLLAAGTEEYLGDAYILFWDIRKSDLLGGYWMSHTDTITQVKFLKEDMNTFISGSTDGLINMYDLQESSEDDALVDTLNTESSIRDLVWFNNESGKNCLCCITHTEDVQLWQMDGAEPYAHFRRTNISATFKVKSEAHCYVVNAHRQPISGVLILCQSSKNCLRTLMNKETKLLPAFEFKGNPQIVRSSWYNENYETLLTAGESGFVNVWNTHLMIK